MSVRYVVQPDAGNYVPTLAWRYLRYLLVNADQLVVQEPLWTDDEIVSVCKQYSQAWCERQAQDYTDYKAVQLAAAESLEQMRLVEPDLSKWVTEPFDPPEIPEWIFGSLKFYQATEAILWFCDTAVNGDFYVDAIVDPLFDRICEKALDGTLTFKFVSTHTLNTLVQFFIGVRYNWEQSQKPLVLPETLPLKQRRTKAPREPKVFVGSQPEPTTGGVSWEKQDALAAREAASRKKPEPLAKPSKRGSKKDG